MIKSKSIYWLGGVCAVALCAGIYATAQDGSGGNTQTYPAARYVMMSGLVDVASQASDEPYTMHTITVLDTQTGQMWLLQAEVEMNNNPTLLSAQLIPTTIGTAPIPQQPLNPQSFPEPINGPQQDLD